MLLIFSKDKNTGRKEINKRHTENLKKSIHLLIKIMNATMYILPHIHHANSMNLSLLEIFTKMA